MIKKTFAEAQLALLHFSSGPPKWHVPGRCLSWRFGWAHLKPLSWLRQTPWRRLRLLSQVNIQNIGQLELLTSKKTHTHTYIYIYIIYIYIHSYIVLNKHVLYCLVETRKCFVMFCQCFPAKTPSISFFLSGFSAQKC